MRLSGKRIIALVDKDFEDWELWYPVHRVREEGAEVHLAGDKAGKIYIGKYGVPATSDYAFEDIDSGTYDGVLSIIRDMDRRASR
ncbi:putative intracellular protease/amidase [Paenibacillus popilliae ATCC 14706]|uniref:Putative intracellular protease/amidase n=1 Tax=Paenibacillus popilliae ATCC 14706 TaxID=1212764 RepID=M9LGG5_PAEPP|nr:putative intracellular protease/amidase [Paenibacillus popilliae ATCC 14706]